MQTNTYFPIKSRKTSLTLTKRVKFCKRERLDLFLLPLPDAGLRLEHVSKGIWEGFFWGDLLARPPIGL